MLPNITGDAHNSGEVLVFGIADASKSPGLRHMQIVDKRKRKYIAFCNTKTSVPQRNNSILIRCVVYNGVCSLKNLL